MEIVLFFLGAIVLNGGSKLIHKYVLKDVEAYSYAILFNFLGAAVFFVLALDKIHIPKDQNALIALLGASFLWTCIAVINFISYKQEELSLREPVYQIRVLFTLILGVIFLRESFSFFKSFATILLFIGLFILLYHKERKWSDFSRPGILWTLLTALLMGGVAVVDKYSLNYFNVETYGFLVFLIPACFLSLGLFKKNERSGLSYLLKNKWQSAFLGVGLGTLGYYFVLKVYQSIELTVAFPLLQLNILIAVLGGIFIFKEKENIPRKIIGTVIIILGTILLKFS